MKLVKDLLKSNSGKTFLERVNLLAQLITATTIGRVMWATLLIPSLNSFLFNKFGLFEVALVLVNDLDCTINYTTDKSN